MCIFFKKINNTFNKVPSTFYYWLLKNFRNLITGGVKKLIRDIKVYFYYPELRKISLETKSDEEHLSAVMDWLCLAQDVTDCGGISNAYDIANKKWGTPYRETTGYIIETFINYFHDTNNPVFLNRAIKMGDWEIKIQCDDGSIGELKKDGSVGKKIFNTGQVMIGWLALYEETKDQRYLTAAEKAGQWLVENQAEDGSWKVFTTQGPRTYQSRVAWPLEKLAKITNNKAYSKAAQNNIRWILSQQKPNYWFDHTSLMEKNQPWTHLIAYTINGLIEYYLISDNKDKQIFNSFYNSANTLLEIFKRNNYTFLPCSFDQDWKSDDKYTCLTGDAQLAIVWMQIYELTKENKFLDGANKILDLVKATQILETKHREIRGGIFGSYPFGGEYATYLLINWAAKFFADALLLQKKIKA